MSFDADLRRSPWLPHASGEPPPKAGARHERTLEAVGSTAWLGGFSLKQSRASHEEWVGCPIALVVSNGAMALAVSDGRPGVGQECSRPHDGHGRLARRECTRVVGRPET